MMRVGLAAAVLGLVAGTAGLARADITFISTGQGWVEDTGDGDGVHNGGNDFTGNEASFTGGNYHGDRYNSIAAFDLSSLQDHVTGAQLTLNLAEHPLNSGAVYTLGIYDVSTPLVDFYTSSAGVAAYQDLGSGSQYGTVTGSTGSYTVILSSQAVDDINKAAGGMFAIGFTNITLNAQDPSNAGTSGLGSYPNGDSANQGPVLQLQTGPSSPIATPEPSTLLPVVTVGLAVLGGWARRRAARS